MFKKVLIANRGEIALRVLRACKELSIETVAIHSTADAEAMHVRLADESVCVGPGPSMESYMNIPSIMAAAVLTNADAIHPGFGFLSENSRFAHIVEEHGIAFIGPSSQHIAEMGNKVFAKKTAQKLQLPLIPGSDGAVSSAEEIQQLGERVGYPLLIKASAGGGGKGMRLVKSQSEIAPLLEAAQSEALSNFKDDAVYVEKYLTHPRHVEVQILGDAYGNVVCLGERECSLQRRHQKIWEESPCMALTAEEREHLLSMCQNAMKTLGYRNAGTLEFLYQDGQFYFIEMNTRIQVEHPVTEMVTGIDLVKWQIQIAAGHPLTFSQSDIVLRGHAIECRINAENPMGFVPSPGRVESYLAPGGPFVRVDSALFPGAVIPPYYDSLISKVVVHGNTRSEALSRMRRALEEYVITGIDTLIPLHLRLISHLDVIEGNINTHWLEDFLSE